MTFSGVPVGPLRWRIAARSVPPETSNGCPVGYPRGHESVRAAGRPGCADGRPGTPVLERMAGGPGPADCLSHPHQVLGSVRETAARETAQRFVQAIASGSPGIAGELLAPRARDPVASTSAGDCAASPAVARLPRAPVGTLAMWGEEAQARTGRDTLFLHEFSTGWLVTGAGCRPRNEQVYDCSVGGR